MKVLIVDDETHITSLLQDYFEDKKDHEITLAHSGEEAIEKALQIKPDLIILDIMMPGINGFQVIETLRQHKETAQTPVILSSMIDGPSPAEKKRLGVVDFLRKPINFTKLNYLIGEFTSKRSAESTQEKKSAKPVTVAIIEDDEEDVELLTTGLENLGCSVHSALDGESGIKLVAKIQPDVVILDYVLPTISGVDVIRKLKGSEKTCNIPIILISAYVSLNYKEKLFIFRDNKISEGPFSVRDICNKIKEAVASD